MEWVFSSNIEIMVGALLYEYPYLIFVKLDMLQNITPTEDNHITVVQMKFGTHFSVSVTM